MPNLRGYVELAMDEAARLEVALDRLWRYRETMDATAPNAVSDVDFDKLRNRIEDIAMHEALS